METNLNAQSQKVKMPGIAPSEVVSWDIDPAHSCVMFSIRHLMISNVRGEFSDVQGTVDYDVANPNNSTVTAKIKAASINTHEIERDEHLKSSDFFNVAEFPEITFKSTEIHEWSKREYEVVGNLSIHGINREIRMDVMTTDSETKDLKGDVRQAASATLVLKRSDFKLTWNKALEAGGFLIGDDVNVTLEIEFIKRN